MRLRRLGWAGLEIECGGETLLIDYVQDTAPMAPLLRTPDEPFPSASRLGGTAAALLTHLHADHADANALAVALRSGAQVLRPAPATGSPEDLELTSLGEAKFLQHRLATRVPNLWEESSLGPFRVCAVPAVDGFGDPQYSWIVQAGDLRIFHGGDTLFHGFWWHIARQLGPFDIAFLPINAPLTVWPHLQPPSPLEATMTPEQATVAAHLLSARSITPIHYGSLHKPGMYTETLHPTERLEAAALKHGIAVKLSAPGEWFEKET